MGRSIIKQGNGKYAVWSTIVDNFIIYDATPEEIVVEYLSDEKQRIVDLVDRQIEKPNMTIKDCLRRIKDVHGLGEMREVREIIQ